MKSKKAMKFHRLFFAFLISLAAFQFCFSQDKPKAVLIWKFGKVINDELLAVYDNFYSTVYDTNSKGYVIVYGTEDDPLTKYTFESHIKGCFRWTKRSDENFVFVLGENRKEFEVEFWKVPNGADKPQYTETPRDYKLVGLTEPRMFYKLNIADEYCPLYFDMEFYSKFLNANSNLVGKITIYEKTLKSYQREKQKYLRELTATNKVSARQIIFVRGKYYGEPDAEFWLVRQKKK